MNTEKVVNFLESLKRTHLEVDSDCWFSCPKSGHCCNESLDEDKCTCGADEHNKKIDKFISELK